MFKIWSESSEEARKMLRPDLGLKVWDSLSEDEKYRIWKYLDFYFFDKDPKWGRSSYGEEERYFEFFEPYDAAKRQRINASISSMYHLYKAKNYTTNYLEIGSHYAACCDFYSIFMNQNGHAVLELISFYCLALLKEREGSYYLERSLEQDENEYREEVIKWELSDFTEFAMLLNDVFASFGLNVYLTKAGFIPRQDEKIAKEIFEPVINCLADKKWIEVNNLFSDAFSEYRKNTPNGYSTCVTHTVSAMQAFLQILVYGKTGSGEISKLIVQAQKQNRIPSDMFTKEIFKNIESIVMRERQETGDPHPKQEYATEKNARLVLNLAMIFLQHCLVN